jgi:membrane associated rhomboid family serine protease
MHRMAVALFQDTSRDPRRSGPEGPAPDRRPAREPVFNAPAAAIALVAIIVGGYALQSRFPIEAVVQALAFSPQALEQGRWHTLVTALFLHGNWGHALMNGAFALAFATPLARFFGEGARGTAIFFLFYVVCGVLSNLGYAAVHPGDALPLVGASGAVSGLMGASSRLIAGRGRVGPIFSSPVLGMGAAWLVVNGLVGVLGGGFLPGSGGAGVAWEAHLAGFLAGVLLIWPFAYLAERR